MASVQCKKTVHVHETTSCQQKCQANQPSLGQKMSNWVKGGNQAQDPVKPMCPNHGNVTKSQAHHRPTHWAMGNGHGPEQAKPICKAHSQAHHRPTHQQAHPVKPKAHCGAACQCVGKLKSSHGLQTANGCATCHPHNKGPAGERSFFGRIKDRMSGSGSDDSSDSDNDECCRKRKN